MKVYSDSNVVYSANASSIDAQVALADGNHWIVVQAWDNHGNVYKALGFWIDITSGGGGNRSYINRTFNTVSSGASELNTAVQLDGDYNQQNYSLWIDQMQVTAW
ncbi:MAG: hypothetical protein ABSC64_03275 [Candidatus Korobacteraceae bacterium]|jgi:hypothetical protein